jgi:hypothetical protein
VIALLILLVFMGVALYLVGFIPMDAAILKLVRVVVIIVAVLMVLAFFFPGYMPAGMRKFS